MDPPGHLDEEALFEFGSVGEMIAATSTYTCPLAVEASNVRVAPGKAPVDDPGDAAIECLPAVPGEGGR